MTTKFKGIKKLFAARPDLVVPPLNFRDLQALQARIAGFTGGVDMESLNVVVDATHAALKRNYPEMTRDETVDLLDLENMTDVFAAVMDVSGLRRKALEAAEAPPGEAEAPSTGTSATPS